MGDWFQRRLEGIVDNLIFAGILAGGIAVWALLKTLPGPIVFVISLAVFIMILGLLRLILSFVDRSQKKRRNTILDSSKTTAIVAHEYIADSYIKGRMIYLMDLLAPGAKPIVSNRTIEDCEVRGPAMIVLMGATIADSSWDGDLESLFVEIADKRMIFGAIGLQGCVFRRCRFTAIGILGTREQIEKAKQGFTVSTSHKEGSQP